MKRLLFCVTLLHIAFALADVRILGGRNATILERPYQASFEMWSGAFICGASIIARTWVLTTARCVTGWSANNTVVRVGTTYRGLGGTVLNVSLFEIHENFSTDNHFDYDIALVKLEQPIPLSETTQIIGLADNDERFVEGTIGTITGWGYTQVQKLTIALRTVDIQIINVKVCRDLFAETYAVTDRMICAGDWDGNVDFCAGDNGGPFVINSKVVGLSSWHAATSSAACGTPQQPGVYTNIGALRDWITEKTGI